MCFYRDEITTGSLIMRIECIISTVTKLFLVLAVSTSL